MNDFTKNELIAICACIKIHGDNYSCGQTAHETLVDKLQSMIEKFNEYECSEIRDVNQIESCSKCGKHHE